MNTPEPEDLRRIERSHFRGVMHRKLPLARQSLADAVQRKYADEKEGGAECPDSAPSEQ